MDTHFHLTGRKSTCVACRHKDRRDENARRYQLDLARETRLREQLHAKRAQAGESPAQRQTPSRGGVSVRTVVLWIIAVPLALLGSLMILSLMLGLLTGGSGPAAAVLAWVAVAGTVIGVIAVIRRRNKAEERTALVAGAIEGRDAA